MVNPAEHRYLDARRQLQDAAEQLARLDAQATEAGTPVDRRSALTRASDPLATAEEILKQDWPDRVELSDVVTAWLEAYEQTKRIWAELPPATQLRLAQPPGD